MLITLEAGRVSYTFRYSTEAHRCVVADAWAPNGDLDVSICAIRFVVLAGKAAACETSFVLVGEL